MATLASLKITLSPRPSPGLRPACPPIRFPGFIRLDTSGSLSRLICRILDKDDDGRHSSIMPCRCGSRSVGFTVDINAFGDVYFLFQEIGLILSEEETEAVLDKHPDIYSTSLDSIRSRIHALKSVGLDVLQISSLVTKRPTVLTAGEVEPVTRFVRDDLRNEVKPTQIVRLFSRTDPSLLTGFDTKVRLLSQHGIPQEKIAHILNHINFNKAICRRSEENLQRTLTVLNRYGGLGIVIRRPTILNYNLDNQLIPRIEYLRKLSNNDDEATAQVIKRLPAVLLYSAEHMESQVEFMRSFAGLSYEEIFKIVLIFPNLMSASKERKLEPRITFLKQCGFDSNDISRLLTKSPLFLGLSFERNLAYKLAMLVKIGYEHRTKDLAAAMGAVTRTSFENLQKVIGLYLSYGLSCEDIVAMSRKHPQVLQYNPNTMEEKMEYLVEGMGREVGELLAFPAYLGYNLDKRIKHRYEVKRKTIGEGLSINKLLTVSVDRFAKARKRQQEKDAQKEEETVEME